VKRLLCAALALVSAGAVAQAPPAFVLPLRCELGKTCIVQNYVDRDPGPGARDYHCGSLTYDGHKGTDIRVIDGEALRRGVSVLAAADGRVRAVRDGMPDVSVRALKQGAVAGREAGNSVAIEHGGGWETQYGHMRRHSVAVRPGDIVRRGQVIGVVGMSGETEFPHLHFEVRRAGATVDPFVGAGGGDACRPGARPLWTPEALAALAYRATGVLGAGISGEPPALGDWGIVGDGAVAFGAGSRAAIFWVQIYGAQSGDVEELRLLAPGGRVLAQRRARIPRERAQSLIYAGARHGKASWPAGVYRGEYALYRGRDKVIALVREVRPGP
jgi:peptidase M23-like protein